MKQDYSMKQGIELGSKYSSQIILCIITISLSLISTSLCGLTTLNVGNGYQFSSIQEAVNAALEIEDDEDVLIRIAPGTYSADNTIEIQLFDTVPIVNLSLEPMEGIGSVTLTKPVSTPLIEVIGDESETRSISIKGFNISSINPSGNNYGIKAHGGLNSLTVRNCHFDNISEAVFLVGNDYSSNRVMDIYINDNVVQGGGLLTARVANSHSGTDYAGVISIVNNQVLMSQYHTIQIQNPGIFYDRNPEIIITGNYIECFGSDNASPQPVSINRNMPVMQESTRIEGNTFINTGIKVRNSAIIRSNKFIRDSDSGAPNPITVIDGMNLDPESNIQNAVLVERNIFWGPIQIPISMEYNSYPCTLPLIVRNNSFLNTDKALLVTSNEDTIDPSILLPELANNIFKTTYAPCQSAFVTFSSSVILRNSWFNVPQASQYGFVEDETTCISGGNPFVFDNDNNTYTLPWTEEYKSPLINTGYPGENGELTDPDGTPPDIGCVYYPHVNRQYFERVNPIMWLSFPVLDDRSNTDGTYWNELGYMFEEHMQDAPNSQLDQIQWSYDGQSPTMQIINGIWQHFDSRSIQQKGYKVQFNTSGAISDVVVNGFRVDPATTPVAWLAEIEENGQSRPFENWIGYFVPFREKAGNAFSHLVPGTNGRKYLDYIYSMKTQHWSTSRQSATHSSPWIIDPNKYTLSEGDMVSLILLPDAPQEMYWNNSSLNIDPREVAKSTAFSYDEKLDYQPVYIEFDPENIPEEIGLYVGGVCQGAAVVDSSKISVCLYNDASKAGGDLELVFYYEGKGKSMSEGWTVYNPQSLVFENTGLRADQIGDYAYISFNREEGESPTPLVTSLRQNYPNPFNPSTTLSFVLGTESEANLDIFNARGQLIRSFRYDQLARGLHTVEWDGKDSTGRTVSSGLYFYRLRTPETSLVNKMLLLK